MTPPPGPLKEDRKEACRTFTDQTKQLLGLASAFIVVPAGVKLFLDLELSLLVVGAEVAFVLSVLLGYLTIGSIAGTQESGDYDVYRKATQRLGKGQIATYVTGLALFGTWFVGAQRSQGVAGENAGPDVQIFESGCCMHADSTDRGSVTPETAQPHLDPVP